MADEDDFLMGGGGTSAKFDVGTVVRGTILSKALRQRTDITTREPLFWKDGRPQQHLVVALQTDERDADIDDDDGVRNLYIRFKMREAVQEAVKKAGAKTLEVGGKLAVKCTGQEKPKQRGHNGAKIYRAKYEAPDPADFLAGDDDGESDETDEAPTPPPAAKKAAAKKAPAKKAAAKKAAVDEFADDDDAPAGGDIDDDPGF